MILHWRIVVEYQVLPISTKSIDRIAIRVSQFVWISIDRSLTTIHCTLILKDCIIGSAGHITLLPCTLPAVRKIIVNLRLAYLTLLGGNEYYTIGSTGTIDSTRSSILQHLDTLDITRVEIVETTLDRHAVYDVERI